jgi:hypothetical protein
MATGWTQSNLYPNTAPAKMDDPAEPAPSVSALWTQPGPETDQ